MISNKSASPPPIEYVIGLLSVAFTSMALVWFSVTDAVAKDDMFGKVKSKDNEPKAPDTSEDETSTKPVPVLIILKSPWRWSPMIIFLFVWSNVIWVALSMPLFWNISPLPSWCNAPVVKS